jgi:phage terminase large subunit-like protein
MTAPFELDLDALNSLPEGERLKELHRLAPLQRLLETNPLWSWVPHEGEKQWKLENDLDLDGSESRGQVEFLEAETKTAALVAGNRYGKSDAGAGWALTQTLPIDDRWLLPPWLHRFKRWGLDGEPVYGRIVGPDLGQWLEKVMLPKLRRMIPREALFKGDFDKAYKAQTRKLLFADGSWWDFLTHEMDVDAFAGADLHFVWFDEEPPGEKGKLQFEESWARVTDYDGHVRWTLTPLLGLGFVYYELTNRNGNPRDDEDCKVVTGDMEHNPHLSEKGKQSFLARFRKDPLKLAARKSGRWVHFAGQIYSEWSDHKHVVPDREIPRRPAPANPESDLPAVPIYEAIDPGINKDHQVALIWAWVDENDLLEVFHAIKRPDWTVEDAAGYIQMFRGEHMFTPRWTVIDPAAQNRYHGTGRSLQWEYQRHGIWTLPGQNNRQAGFNAVKERLRPMAPEGTPELPPKLVVQASCEELIDEFHTYRWKSPKGTGENAPKLEPIKRNDDLLDALRYLVMSMPQKAESTAVPTQHDRDRELVREHIEYLAGDRFARWGGVA